MNRSYPEARVVLSLKKHLSAKGLRGCRAKQILVDADPSYTGSPQARELEPLARMDIAGLRPDVVCSLDRSDRTVIAGFEVKPEGADILKGFAQAREYRRGVHFSYLAVPANRKNLRIGLESTAREAGIGLLVLDGPDWHEIIEPADPLPRPWDLGSIEDALRGVPLARRLQLNHPMNYLVVPLIAAKDHERPLEDALSEAWTDLGSAGTRKHAVSGARSLGLLDLDGRPTAQGLAVREILDSIGFDVRAKLDKRRRLSEVAPQLAAVARFVFLQQPAVQLIYRVLRESKRALSTVELAASAYRKDRILGAALFFSDPSLEPTRDLPPAAYSPSTVFKLKQNLWHCAILVTPKHTSAGLDSKAYRPDEDVWALSPSLS